MDSPSRDHRHDEQATRVRVAFYGRVTRDEQTLLYRRRQLRTVRAALAATPPIIRCYADVVATDPLDTARPGRGRTAALVRAALATPVYTGQPVSNPTRRTWAESPAPRVDPVGGDDPINRSPLKASTSQRNRSRAPQCPHQTPAGRRPRW